jgi:polyisoprenoid-binding protein YceI
MMLGVYWHAGVLVALCQALMWNAAPVLAELARWNVDPDHSTIEFRVSHVVVSKTTGGLWTTAASSTWMRKPGS